MTQKKKAVSGVRRLGELAVFVAGTTLVMFVLSSIALVLYTKGVAEPAITTLQIDEGSAAMIESGENPLDVPPVWTFNAGDMLTLINHDGVEHTLGGSVVRPGESTTIEMDVATGGELPTSLHPLGIITLSVEPSRFDFSIIAFTTFAFGISVGVILYVGVSIVRAMGHDDDGDWSEVTPSQDDDDGAVVSGP